MPVIQTMATDEDVEADVAGPIGPSASKDPYAANALPHDAEGDGATLASASDSDRSIGSSDTDAALASPSPSGKKKRWIAGASALALFAILAVGLGVGLGKKNRRSSDQAAIAASHAGTAGLTGEGLVGHEGSEEEEEEEEVYAAAAVADPDASAVNLSTNATYSEETGEEETAETIVSNDVDGMAQIQLLPGTRRGLRARR